MQPAHPLTDEGKRAKAGTIIKQYLRVPGQVSGMPAKQYTKLTVETDGISFGTRASFWFWGITKPDFQSFEHAVKPFLGWLLNCLDGI
jgi:hypothetical protein